MIAEIVVLGVCALVVFAWCGIGLAVLIDAFRADVWFVPTRDHALEPVLKALDLSPGDILYDLGCGDAKILAAARQRVPVARYVGIEKGLIPYSMGRFRRRNGIELRFEDLAGANISDATHIYLYLSPSVLAKIEEKVFSEAQRGTRIVSCSFEFRNHDPVAHVPIETTSPLARELFVYEVL